jgi:hypothetical protein
VRDTGPVFEGTPNIATRRSSIGCGACVGLDLGDHCSQSERFGQVAVLDAFKAWMAKVLARCADECCGEASWR